MESTKINYLVVELCDNDFGYQLQEAVTKAHSVLGKEATTRQYKVCVVQMTVALCCISDAFYNRVQSLDSNFEYLNERVNVKYQQDAPDEDHDGGSVAVDLNSGYIWRF